MTDENNVNKVLRKSTKSEEAFRKFQEVHKAFSSRCRNPVAIEKLGNYYASVLNQVQQLQVNVHVWLKALKLTRSLEIHPEDSVPNVGLHFFVTIVACVTEFLSKYILKAEAATIKMTHEIKEE